MLTPLSMASLVVYAIFDVLCAALGIVALLRSRKCARGRLAVGISGVALLLHGTSSLVWRLWLDLYLLPSQIEGTSSESTESLFEAMSLVRSIFGLLLLSTATVLLVVALAVRARHEFPARPHAGHAAVGPTQQPQHQGWYGPGHAPPAPAPQHPGQWSMPGQPLAHGTADSAQQNQARPSPGQEPGPPRESDPHYPRQSPPSPHHGTPPPPPDGGNH